MSKINEDEIKRRFKKISKFQTSPVIIARDLEKTRIHLSKITSEPRTSGQNKWRTIMKNRITKYASAAIVIIASIIILHQLGTPIDGANTAFAKALRNADNMPWVHMVSKAKIIKEDSQLASGISDSEKWFNISSQITINIYGKVIHYSDFKNKINYTYRPNENKLLISAISTTWEESIKYNSNSDFLSTLLQLPEQFTGNITRKTGQYQNKKVDIYQIRADINQTEHNLAFNASFEAVVDPTTNLIIVVFEKVEDVSGQHISDLEISFSYPETGPKDIYELGVPDNAEIVNYLNQPEN
jgi:hypothetical protein